MYGMSANTNMSAGKSAKKKLKAILLLRMPSECARISEIKKRKTSYTGIPSKPGNVNVLSLTNTSIKTGYLSAALAQISCGFSCAILNQK